MKRKTMIWQVIIALVVLLVPSVFAGDEDTHYILTYYIARQVGFSEKQAQQIASATVSLDLDENTWPVVEGVPKRLSSDTDQYINGVDRLTRYHAMLDHRIKGATPTETLKKQMQARTAQLQSLYKEAVLTGNIGPYLHAKQDSFVHKDDKGIPYSARLGHTLAGTRPDYLSNNEERTREVVDATIKALSRFMKDRLHQEPKTVNEAQLTKVLEALKNANPRSKAMENSDPLHKEPPDVDRAKEAVEKALQNNPDPEISDLNKMPPKSRYYFKPERSKWFEDAEFKTFVNITSGAGSSSTLAKRKRAGEDKQAKERLSKDARNRTTGEQEANKSSGNSAGGTGNAPSEASRARTVTSPLPKQEQALQALKQYLVDCSVNFRTN